MIVLELPIGANQKRLRGLSLSNIQFVNCMNRSPTSNDVKILSPPTQKKKKILKDLYLWRCLSVKYPL